MPGTFRLNILLARKSYFPSAKYLYKNQFFLFYWGDFWNEVHLRLWKAKKLQLAANNMVCVLYIFYSYRGIVGGVSLQNSPNDPNSYNLGQSGTKIIWKYSYKFVSKHENRVKVTLLLFSVSQLYNIDCISIPSGWFPYD